MYVRMFICINARMYYIILCVHKITVISISVTVVDMHYQCFCLCFINDKKISRMLMPRFYFVSEKEFCNREVHIAVHTYRVGQKKVSQIIFAITLSTVIQFSYFLAHVHYRKFATGGCIVSPPNVVCVTTLPCKILSTTFLTLNSIHC